jgi:hypothetical protein
LTADAANVTGRAPFFEDVAEIMLGVTAFPADSAGAVARLALEGSDFAPALEFAPALDLAA